MKTKRVCAAPLVLVAMTVAACQAGGGAGGSVPPGVCRADAAETLTGMDRLTDQRAMQLTGATLVRQISPGQGVTMDYRRERLTIETDPKTGKILRAACG